MLRKTYMNADDERLLKKMTKNHKQAAGLIKQEEPENKPDEAFMKA